MLSVSVTDLVAVLACVLVWGVRGHQTSSETWPFERAHMIFYSTLIETMRLSCTVFELQRVFRRKWPI